MSLKQRNRGFSVIVGWEVVCQTKVSSFSLDEPRFALTIFPIVTWLCVQHQQHGIRFLVTKTIPTNMCMRWKTVTA